MTRRLGLTCEWEVMAVTRKEATARVFPVPGKGSPPPCHEFGCNFVKKMKQAPHAVTEMSPLFSVIILSACCSIDLDRFIKLLMRRLCVTRKRSAEQGSVAELQAMLRGVGLRSTAARMGVLERLRNATHPLSHAELAEEMTPLGFDKATVFRNLSDLTDAGLVMRTELGDHVWRFELRDEEHQKEGQHPHFVCVDCGGVTCLAEKTVVLQLKAVNTIGIVTEILLRGHCKNCH